MINDSHPIARRGRWIRISFTALTSTLLERVINFSTVLARVYARPLTLRDLVNFLDGTKSLSK